MTTELKTTLDLTLKVNKSISIDHVEKLIYSGLISNENLFSQFIHLDSVNFKTKVFADNPYHIDYKRQTKIDFNENNS